MDSKLNLALQNVETSYRELVDIANDMLAPIVAPVDSLIAEVESRINSLSVDMIRDFILRLQLKACEISEVKEKSAMKAELAQALQKEAFAVKFNSLDGSAAAKEKIALAATSAELASSALYNLAANLIKAKVDQLHRLVDALKSILMSRMQETKFMNIGSTNEMPGTTNGRVILNEDKRGTF